MKQVCEPAVCKPARQLSDMLVAAFTSEIKRLWNNVGCQIIPSFDGMNANLNTFAGSTEKQGPDFRFQVSLPGCITSRVHTVFGLS
ncbi:MAG: hypothetical protein DRH32_10280 [Deltaproteobacteria bacterium]|nr:MAG: hypothetical protein DRH32_10280 [Deltaproteobacteria bacterium]